MKYVLQISIVFSTIIMLLSFQDDRPILYGNSRNVRKIGDMTMVRGPQSSSMADFKNIIFNKSGEIMFFDNFGNKSASHTIILLPFVGGAELLQANKDGLQYKHASGAVFQFDPEGKMNIPGLDLHETSFSDLPNAGVKVGTFSRGLVIDLGTAQGKNPHELMDKSVSVKDKHGQTCTLRVKDLYKKINKYDSDPLFHTNAEYLKFFRSSCSHLDLSDLEHPIIHSTASKTVRSFGEVPKPAPTEERDPRVDNSPRGMKASIPRDEMGFETLIQSNTSR